VAGDTKGDAMDDAMVRAQDSSDLELRKFVAPEIVFGAGARTLAGRYARNLGASKVLLVTDPGVVSAGWSAQVAASLEAEGLPYAVYSDVSANPLAEQVMTGADLYRSEGCNAIVAVGGGSPMDCAKGIGIVCSNNDHVLRFEGVDQVRLPGPPLVCVPTTAGSSADVSQFAIINDTRRRTKIAIISKSVVPDMALIDPVTTTTMGSYLTACTGLDALTHAFEAFASNAHSSLTDVHALEAVRLVSANLVAATQRPDDLGVRGMMMMGCLHAGLAFSNASLGAVHAMAHSLGGLLDLAHGECNAILLGHVAAFNYEAAPERYRRLAEALRADLSPGGSAEDDKAAMLEALARLRDAVGVSRTLAQAGVRLDDIPELAEKAMKDPCMVTNPRRPCQRDIEVAYEAAL